MASGLLERTSGLDPETAAEQEELSKNAVAAAYTGAFLYSVRDESSHTGNCQVVPTLFVSCLSAHRTVS